MGFSQGQNLMHGSPKIGDYWMLLNITFLPKLQESFEKETAWDTTVMINMCAGG